MAATTRTRVRTRGDKTGDSGSAGWAKRRPVFYGRVPVPPRRRSIAAQAVLDPPRLQLGRVLEPVVRREGLGVPAPRALLEERGERLWPLQLHEVGDQRNALR